MNGPGILLSYDSPNEYGLFPSGASGEPKHRRGERRRRVSVAPFAIPGKRTEAKTVC
ncbi:MAG: hypothetical protein LBU32_08690 [Clostridiales bacterium]|nr:hypothetical protein [Clostridiales bacterium]